MMDFTSVIKQKRKKKTYLLGPLVQLGSNVIRNLQTSSTLLLGLQSGNPPVEMSVSDASADVSDGYMQNYCSAETDLYSLRMWMGR
jgi:hypothetical protein